MFLGADIPLKKVNNPFVKKFLSTYTAGNVPDKLTLRRYSSLEF